MISAPRSRNDASAPSAAAMQADSFRVGMMIEITEWKVWRVFVGAGSPGLNDRIPVVIKWTLA
jgi:threonine/homoserine/homoserine lactone efflux protein